MADNFSLDDILAEVEQKKSHRSADEKKSGNISITDILSDEIKIKSTRFQEKKTEPAVIKTQETVKEEKPEATPKNQEIKKPKPVQAEEKAKTEKEPVQRHFLKQEKRPWDTPDVTNEMKIVKEAPTQKKQEKKREKGGDTLNFEDIPQYETIAKKQAPEKKIENKAPIENKKKTEKQAEVVEEKSSASIEAKKPLKKKNVGVTQILEELPTPEKQAVKAEEKKPLKKKNVGVTQILEELPTPEKQAAKAEEKKPLKKKNVGVTQILEELPTPEKQAVKAEEKKPEKKKNVGVTQILEELPQNDEQPFKIDEQPFKVDEQAFEIGEIPQDDGSGYRIYDTQELDEEKERLLSTGSIEIDENDVQPHELFEKPKKEKPHKKKKGISEEEKKKMLMTMQLEKEEAFDDPDDLIDAINPFEVRSRAITDFDDDFFVGGNTMGLAGNDLKELAGADKEKTDTDELLNVATRPIEDENEKMLSATQEHIKTYEPKPHAKSEKERRSDTSLLESLNKAIAKKHKEEENIFRKPSITGTLGSIQPPENGLNIDYSNKLIPDTGTVGDLSQEFEAVDKRKKKLRDFVLENGHDDDDDDDENDGLEFDSYDTTGQIWADLCESHKGLRTRFIFLLAISAVLFLITLFGDLRYVLDFSIFGVHISFLAKSVDSQGFIIFNLVLGFIGTAFCGSVVKNGVLKLFKGRADCDSVCSLVTIASLISAIPLLMNSSLLQDGKAFLYIPVAMAALLFNTLGKMIMIVRAKRNFRFISGDTKKYSAMIVHDDATASAFTKGVVKEIPFLAAMRKTEFLTDFLKNSYCEDKADRISRLLTPISVAAALLFAVIAYFVPNGIEGMEKSVQWAITVGVSTLGILSPFSMMFIVNYPLSRAGRTLSKTNSVVLGYEAAEEFSETNSVVVDAATLFPEGTALYSNIKHLSQPNSINNIALDQAIILAASLAIKSGSVLSNMFRDMINDKEEILAKIDNCVYEDNMGILGWFGNKRMIMGNREQMKHHDIKIPNMDKVKKYNTNDNDTIYLAVGGEIVIIFFVQLVANNEIKEKLQKLEKKGVSLVVKTTDSIVTVAKLAEIFEIDPEMIRILPYSMHEQYNNVTKYVSRGNGAVSCSGTFTSLASAVLAAKALVKDISIGSGIMLAGAALGGICAAALGAFGQAAMLTPSMLIGWNFIWCLIALIAESIRKY